MPLRTLFVDVDKTLIDDEGNLYEGVGEKLQMWADKYQFIYAWSYSGFEWAKKIAERFQLDQYFDDYFDKPDCIVDDSPENILRLAAVLRVDGKDWWKQSDTEMFSKSREGDKRGV